MSQVKYAFKGKIYLNSTSYGSPTWNEVKAVRDVKVGADFDKQDATTRAGGGLKQFVATLLELGITGLIRTDETDTTGFAAMETAFLARGVLDVLILDGPRTTNGSRGYRFDSQVFKFGEDQKLEGVLYREFDVAPTPSANDAYSAVVSGGAPVFTDLAA